MVKRAFQFIILLGCLLIVGGCKYIQTVYVPHGQAVRLRETVKKVEVWVKTETGEIVPGKIDLPEGWYCLPMEKKE